MGLLDYKNFLVKESVTFINAEDTQGIGNLGAISQDDDNHDKKIERIKTLLQEEAFKSIKDVMIDRLPAGLHGKIDNVMTLIKRDLKVSDLPAFITILTSDPLKLSATSFSQKKDISQELFTHYGQLLPASVFKQIGTQVKDDGIGPFEIVLTIFSTLKKQSVAGDLIDTSGTVIEVKGETGRLKTKSSPGSSQGARDAIINILGVSPPSEKSLGTKWIEGVFPATKNKKFTTEEATQFVTALSQYPNDWSTGKSDAVKLIESGVSTSQELLNLLIAIQLLSYYDSSKDNFSYILNFTDGYDMCKAFRIEGASLGELMTSASEFTIAPWGTVDQEGGIVIKLRKL